MKFFNTVGSINLADELHNFSQEDVRTLYLQHMAETGQKFTDGALLYAFQQTQGQPWLVNALAYQACFRDPLTTLRSGTPDVTHTITQEVLDRAIKAIIARCDTHLDALVDRLQEPRVRAFLDVIISGSAQLAFFNNDDAQYVRDLGLIAQKIFSIANLLFTARYQWWWDYSARICFGQKTC